MDDLSPLGWTSELAAQFAPLQGPGLRAGRVVLEHGRSYRIATAAGEFHAVATGRLRHEAKTAAELPTVGDWVIIDGGNRRGDDRSALVFIRHVFPRRTKLSRQQAGARAAEQVVAANVDTVFLMMGLDGDFNPRRLERYLAVASAGGTRAVVLLNKADACTADELVVRQAEVATAAPGVPVRVLCLRDEGGDAPVHDLLSAGQTFALLGSSGVGKSTLLNRLTGNDVQRTGDLASRSGRGKHTTSSAQLFALPGGALVIDTPGLREIQLWDPDQALEGAFTDIDALAPACRFDDCAHGDEPDCAVRAALADGRLGAERYASYRKLREELVAKRDPREPVISRARRLGGRRRRRR